MCLYHVHTLTHKMGLTSIMSLFMWFASISTTQTLPSLLVFSLTLFLYPPPSSATYPPCPPSSSLLSQLHIDQVAPSVCVSLCGYVWMLTSLVLLWSMRSTWWPDRHPPPPSFFVVFFPFFFLPCLLHHLLLSPRRVSEFS